MKSASDFLRRDENGKLIFDSRVDGAGKPGPEVAWTPPLPPHSVENVGTAEILLITVELKRAGVGFSALHFSDVRFLGRSIFRF